MFKFTILLLAVSAASACQWMAAPGTTLTTTTVTSASAAGGAGVNTGLIRSSWEKLRKNGKVAPKIFLRFLQAHPELQKKFSLFADVPQADLMKNGNFLAQAYTIMAGINVVVQSLEVPALLQAEASHLGKTHFVRGVTVPMFEQFATAAVDALREVGNLSEAEISAWETGLSALITGISKSLKQAQDVPHTLTGLTPNQIGDVQRTWANVRGDRNGIVSAVFQKLLGANPNLQAKFEAFASVPAGSLASNAAFNAQVQLVADRLDSMISVLDKPLQIGGQIRYMAFSHKTRGVTRAEFDAFADVLASNLAAKGVTDDDMASWRGMLNNMVGQIAKIQGM